MIKNHRTIIGAIILLMLATSSLSAQYSFAEPNQIENNKSKESMGSEVCQNGGLRTILTEKVVDGKLEVKRYSLSNDITKEDLKRTIQFGDQISNWVYVSNTYNSGIVLFDGKASKLGENFWKIHQSSEEKIGLMSIQERIIEKNWVKTQPNWMESNYNSYKIIFSGKTGEITNEIDLFLTPNLNSKDYEIQPNNDDLETELEPLDLKISNVTLHSWNMIENYL